MFKNLATWMIGRKLLTETGQLDPYSKAKITAVIGIILPIIGPLSTALGHPVEVPDYVYKILAFAGLWAVRDAMPPKPKA